MYYNERINNFEVEPTDVHQDCESESTCKQRGRYVDGTGKCSRRNGNTQVRDQLNHQFTLPSKIVQVHMPDPYGPNEDQNYMPMEVPYERTDTFMHSEGVNK
jgi:hypothetical protein